MHIMSLTSSKKCNFGNPTIVAREPKDCGMKAEKWLNRLEACLGEQHPRRNCSFKSFEDGNNMATIWQLPHVRDYVM